MPSKERIIAYFRQYCRVGPAPRSCGDQIASDRLQDLRACAVALPLDTSFSLKKYSARSISFRRDLFQNTAEGVSVKVKIRKRPLTQVDLSVLICQEYPPQGEVDCADASKPSDCAFLDNA